MVCGHLSFLIAAGAACSAPVTDLVWSPCTWVEWNVVQFASEIKALRASGYVKAGINWTTAARFLTEGRLDSQRKHFTTGLSRFLRRWVLRVGLDGVWQQWSFIGSLDRSTAVTGRKSCREICETSLRIWFGSGCAVMCRSGCAFLKIGLNGSSCAAARQQGERTTEPQPESLQAFCYMAKEFDESRYIADTLDQTRAQLRQLETSPLRVVERLEKVIVVPRRTGTYDDRRCGLSIDAFGGVSRYSCSLEWPGCRWNNRWLPSYFQGLLGVAHSAGTNGRCLASY